MIKQELTDRLFQTLDKMNLNDINNNTRQVLVSGNFIAGRTVKQGAIVEMGIENGNYMEMVSGKYTPILVLVETEVYNKHRSVSAGR